MVQDHPYIYGQGQLPEEFSCATLLMDKPCGYSSFDVIRRLRKLLPVRKIGHAGTLDPMATGLLICLAGRATKKMESYMHLRKTYDGVMRLGEVTPSMDAETSVTERRAWRQITPVELEAARKRFVGAITQRPPMYSAVKVGGERLYKKARRGETVERRENHVNIYEFELTSRHEQDVSFTVTCSKGTYMRALAHDLGDALGVGAHLVALRRTAIGPYRVGDAWTLDALALALQDKHAPGIG